MSVMTFPRGADRNGEVRRVVRGSCSDPVGPVGAFKRSALVVLGIIVSSLSNS